MLKLFLSILATAVLLLLGWDPSMPEYPYKKAVLIYPHSSKWDNIFFVLYILANQRYNSYFLCKRLVEGNYDSWLMFNVFTCDTENRKQENLTDKISEFIKNQDSAVLFICPKGNVSADIWKTGYNVIAKKANVPVIIGGLDYKEKRFKFADKITDITPLYPRTILPLSTEPDQSPINYFYLVVIILILLKWKTEYYRN